MKYVFGFLLALAAICVVLALLLSIAGDVEHLYISFTNYSTTGKAVFLGIIAAAVGGAIALVVFCSTPHVEYGD